ncbi:MAG: hypothetical protein HC898_07755 [Phycisphaerales bacterium]|nr:hypothetical protein [Phycisphaerales bacterium]
MDGEQRINNKGTGSETVQWKFEGLAPGWYEVSTTWSPAGSYTTGASYFVFDGQSHIDTKVFNQRVMPDDIYAHMNKWERIGYYYIQNGSIRVQLSDNIASQWDMVVADAVRVAKQPLVSVSGSRTATWLHPYDLSFSSIRSDVSEWTINWGDGVIETLQASANHTDHVFPPITALRDISVQATFADGTAASVTLPVSVANYIPGADIVFMVDESGSMETEHAWLNTAIYELEDALNALGIIDNRYALIGFGGSQTQNDSWSVPVGNGNGYWGSPSEMDIAFGLLDITGSEGGQEDGYDAISHALTQYMYRQGVPVNFILVSDEDRDSFNDNLSKSFITSQLSDKNITLNTVVNAYFGVDTGVTGEIVGVDADRTGFVADGFGSYYTVEDSFYTGHGANEGWEYTYSDYIDLAWGLGGAAWNINYISSVGLIAESFTKAFVDIKAKEVEAGLLFGLTESTRLNTIQEWSHTVASGTTYLAVDFTNLNFDSLGNAGVIGSRDINDAFELVVLDTATGKPPVDGTGQKILRTITSGSDAVFNITQGQASLNVAGVVVQDTNGNPITSDTTTGRIYIDVSGLVGKELKLVARLVNNDADDATSVTVSFNSTGNGVGTTAMPTGTGENLLAASPVIDLATRRQPIAYSRLRDVTTAFDIRYKHTSLDTQLDELLATLSLTKRNPIQVRGDLLLTVRRIRTQDQNPVQDSSVDLNLYDGLLLQSVGGVEAGTPYIKLNNLLDRDADGFYVNNDAIEHLRLVFDNIIPEDRFDYEVVLLGETNDAPAFTSDPYAIAGAGSGNLGQAYLVEHISAGGAVTPVLEIVKNANNNQFRYKLAATDPTAMR